MVRVLFAILLLVVYYEAFFLLPESIRVPVKGMFRMRDVILVLAPVLMLVFIPRIKQGIRDNSEGVLIVITGILLFALSPLIAQLFFDQPVLTGLLGFRHRFSYLLFFIFSALIVTEKDVKRFCGVMVFLVAAYLLVLMAQRSNPHLGLIHFDASWYERGDRFGGRRLFFPFGLVYLLFFFIVLADFLHGAGQKSKMLLLGQLLFLGLVLRALLLTGTRQFIFLVPLVCLVALWQSRRKYYILALLLVFILCKQAFWMITAETSWLEQSRLSKVFTDGPSLDKETGRQFQTRVAAENFVRSPLFGVGSLIDSKNQMKEYAERGYFNTPDIGITKVAAEYGLLGVLWVGWAHFYAFRRTGRILREAGTDRNSFAVVAARGLRYFYLFLVLTCVTLPPFIMIDSIPVIALTFVIIGVAAKGREADRGGMAVFSSAETSFSTTVTR